jgi:Nickel responsive protein SCO4226-like
MALFLIERNFAEQLEISASDAEAIRRVNDEVGVEWLFSFLSANKKKTYCLYESPSVEAIREAARRLNIPADAVIEVTRIHPETIA